MSLLGKLVDIDEKTKMIDVGTNGIVGYLSIYLILGEKKCIIDTGNPSEVPTLVKALGEANAFPPDMIILTHSHYDHCQGVPKLREIALKEGKDIEVCAYETGIPLLADQSYNQVYDEKERYLNIHDVTPVKDNQLIDLGGVKLRVIHTPGHSDDQMSLLDEESGRLFIGDTLGVYLGKNSVLPPFMPPMWNRELFYSTIEKLKKVNFKQICFAHYGCLPEEEAKQHLETAVSTMEAWWSIFEEADGLGKFHDNDYLTEKLITELDLVLPHLELVDLKLKLGLKILNGVRRLRRKDSLPASKVMLRDFIVPWFSRGYQIYKESLDVES